MVFCGRHIAISSLQLVVEGGGCKVQWVSADVLVAGRYQIHCSVDTGLQVWQWEQSLQKLQNKRGEEEQVWIETTIRIIGLLYLLNTRTQKRKLTWSNHIKEQHNDVIHLWKSCITPVFHLHYILWCKTFLLISNQSLICNCLSLHGCMGLDSIPADARWKVGYPCWYGENL